MVKQAGQDRLYNLRQKLTVTLRPRVKRNKTKTASPQLFVVVLLATGRTVPIGHSGAAECHRNDVGGCAAGEAAAAAAGARPRRRGGGRSAAWRTQRGADARCAS